MKKNTTLKIFIVFISVLLAACQHGFADVRAGIAREILERVLRDGAERSGREVLEGEAKKSAVEALERLTKVYGDDVLKVVQDGGIELLEAVPRFGDDVIELAIKASPAGRRTLARELPDLLPLARRVGVDAIELESRAPGLAVKTFSTFGDDGGKLVAKNVPTEDVPRLLSYGEKADNPETRKLLLEAYEKEGKSLFERIPAKLVLASGLTASMIYGTHRMTEPAVATGDAIRSNEGLAQDAVRLSVVCGGIAFAVIAVLVLWRFGLVPWRRSGIRPAAAPGESDTTIPGAEPDHAQDA